MYYICRKCSNKIKLPSTYIDKDDLDIRCTKCDSRDPMLKSLTPWDHAYRKTGRINTEVQIETKQCKCPKCGKWMPRIAPYEFGIYNFKCNNCDSEVHVKWGKENKNE